METILHFNVTSQYASYGLFNQGLNLLNTVKQYITEHKEQMEGEGLTSVYIREKEDLPAVIFILKVGYTLKYEYWKKVREEVRRSGAEFVSNYYENDPRFRLDDGMTKFI